MRKHPARQLGRIFSSTIRGTLPFLCLLCLLGGSARADECSRVYRYSVRMFSNGLLTINTRVGNIHVEGWDEPRIEVEAEKIVYAKTEKAAAPLFERLQIKLEGRDNRVALCTLYPPRRLWRPFRGESRLSVNYRISMPFDANLSLKCVDGDVSISGMVGTQFVRVNYGNVEITVPEVNRLRFLSARSFLGYVQSNLHGEESAGFARTVSFWNPQGDQDIRVRVRLGGIYVYQGQD